MEEHIKNTKVAILTRIMKAINDSNVKIQPCDLKTLTEIVVMLDNDTHKDTITEEDIVAHNILTIGV